MQTVVITGAGSGLGRALAHCYAQTGFEVCVADMNKESGQAVVEELQNKGASAFFCECDITQDDSVANLVAMLEQRWGMLDVLVNNAGVATAGTLDGETLEQWQWVMDINLLGQVRVTQACLPLLRRSQSSHRTIVNIASQAGLNSGPNMGSYCASKAALVSYSETAYLALADEGIHVSVICPAFFKTNLNKSLRTSEANVQKVVDKLISKAKIDADTIADQIVTQVAKRKFLVVTHAEGRRLHRLKSFLSYERYLAIVLKQLQKYKHKK